MIKRTPSTMRRQRTFILLCAFALGLLGSGLVARQGWAWHQRGWTGLTFLGGGGVAEQDPLHDAVMKGLGLPHGLVVGVAGGSPAAAAGFRPFDLLDRAQSQSDGTIFYRRDVDGRTVEDRLRRVSPWMAPTRLVGWIEGWALGCSLLGLGAWVAWRRPTAASARLFFALMAVASLGFFASSAWQLNLWPASGEEALRWTAVRGTMLLWLLLLLAVLHSLALHLSWVFPRAKSTPHPWSLLVGIYLIPCVPLAMAVVGGYLAKVAGGSWGVSVQLGMTAFTLLACGGLFTGLLLAYTVAMVWGFWCSYRDGGRRERMQVAVPAAVASVALLIPVLVDLLQILGVAMTETMVASPTFWQAFWPSLVRFVAYLSTPIALAYAVLYVGEEEAGTQPPPPPAAAAPVSSSA